MAEIKITEEVSIDEEDLQFRSIYSSGPGGQHVNKNQTAVQLRFNVVQCHSLPHEAQQRLINIVGSRVNTDYELVITARRHRSQERNKREATERLLMFIRKALEKPKPRIKRRRSYAENQTRLEQKRRRSEMKNQRRKVDY